MTSSASRLCRRLWLVAIISFAGCVPAPTEGTPTQNWASDSSNGSLSEERQGFDRAYAGWSAVVSRLAELDLQYQSATERRRNTMVERFDQLVAEGNAAQQEVVRAAVAAYSKNPENNGDLAEFLTGAAYLLLEQEEYEEALRLSQFLYDQGFRQESVSAIAGTAAFASAEFELAEQHFRRPEKEGKSPGPAPWQLEDIDYYKSAWQRERRLRSAEYSAGDLPRVLLTTTQGEIELELFENEAPNTVANFISLVEKGCYDGLTFYRVVGQTMAEAGCPNEDGSGDPGYAIPCECYRDGYRLNFRGSLGMVHQGRNTGGSRFYLAFVPLRRFDGYYTVFGRIVRGMDVLARLQRREPIDPLSEHINPHSAEFVPPADRILAAKVLRKRRHPYTPNRLQLPAISKIRPPARS